MILLIELEKHEVDIRDRDKTEKKLNQLTKLEAKIEQSLNTHQKTLNFLKKMIVALYIAVDFKQDKITYEKVKVSLNDGMKQIMDEIASTKRQSPTSLISPIRLMN